MTDETKDFEVHHADNFESAEERAAAERGQLYATHKAHGSLGMYYLMFPDEAPPHFFDVGRERER